MFGMIGSGPHMERTAVVITRSTSAGSGDAGLAMLSRSDSTAIDVSATRRRIVLSTSLGSVPGSMRQFTTACALCGSAFSACPPWSCVATHVVRSNAL